MTGALLLRPVTARIGCKRIMAILAFPLVVCVQYTYISVDPSLQSDRHKIISISLGSGFLAPHYVCDNYIPDISYEIS